MILHYEFGGDDDHAGDDWEFEVDYDMRVQAIADYAVDSWITHILHKHPNDSDLPNRMRKARYFMREIIEYILRDLDLITDEVEEEFREVIEDYYYDEAEDEWRDHYC